MVSEYYFSFFYVFVWVAQYRQNVIFVYINSSVVLKGIHFK